MIPKVMMKKMTKKQNQTTNLPNNATQLDLSAIENNQSVQELLGKMVAKQLQAH